MLKVLALNMEDPVFSDRVALSVLSEAVIGKLSDVDEAKKQQAVSTYHDIAILFGSISRVLETVEAQYIELEARHEPVGVLSGSLGLLKKFTTAQLYRGHSRGLSSDLRTALAHFEDHDNPRFADVIEKVPWYNTLDRMVFVYNGLLAAYTEKFDKISDLAKHFQNPQNPLGTNPYSRIPEELQQCRNRIEQFAKSLKDFLQLYNQDKTLKRDLLRAVKAHLSTNKLSTEVLERYTEVLRLFQAFRVLQEEKKVEQDRVVETKTEETPSAEFINGPLDQGAITSVSTSDSTSGNTALVVAGVAGVGLLSLGLLFKR